jgi:hypothetical protein
VKQFVGDDEAMSHPLYAGHFAVIVAALLHKWPELLCDELSTLFARVVQYIDLSCWQELLVIWAGWPDAFGLPFPNQLLGFGFVAERAVGFALDPPPCERLEGIYSALGHIITDQELPTSVEFCSDLHTVHRLSESLNVVILNEADRLHRREPPALRLVIGAGVRLLALVAKVLRKVQSPDGPVFAARRFLRQAGKATYSRLDRKYGESPELEQLRISIFPAYWRGGIDKMADLFFRREGGSAEFNRIMIKALHRWHCSKDPAHFEVFIHDHEILAKIAKQPFPLQEQVMTSQTPQLLMNPHVFALARLIYEGKYKETKHHQADEPPQSATRPRPVPRAYLKEYDTFGEWLAGNLWDQIDYVRQKRADIEDILK